MDQVKSHTLRLSPMILSTPTLIPLRKFPEGLLLGVPFLGKGEPPPRAPEA